MSTYNIIAIDGGVSALVALHLLEDLEAASPNFLRKTYLFAGTSSGGISSLMLAKQCNPAGEINDAKAFWRYAPYFIQNTAYGSLLGALGLGSILSNVPMKAVLEQERFLGKTRCLNDLKKYVLITCYRLRPRRNPPKTPQPASFETTWGPERMHNFYVDSPPRGRGLTLVDVALRTSASPVLMPIHQGRVDGGMFANNPSMAAVGELFKFNQALSLNDIRLLSIGNRKLGAPIDTGNASWGYGQWLFNPAFPFLLQDVWTQSGNQGVTEGCADLLSDERFFRLEPAAPGPSNHHLFMRESVDHLRRAMTHRDTPEQLRRAQAWIQSSGWMEGKEPEIE